MATTRCLKRAAPKGGKGKRSGKVQVQGRTAKDRASAKARGAKEVKRSDTRSPSDKKRDYTRTAQSSVARSGSGEAVKKKKPPQVRIASSDTPQSRPKKVGASRTAKDGGIKRVVKASGGKKASEAAKPKSKVRTGIRAAAGSAAGSKAKKPNKTISVVKQASGPVRKISKPATKPKKKSGKAYPTYNKSSKKAQSFRSAFAKAWRDGQKTFPWNGRVYSTKTK